MRCKARTFWTRQVNGSVVLTLKVLSLRGRSPHLKEKEDDSKLAKCCFVICLEGAEKQIKQPQKVFPKNALNYRPKKANLKQTIIQGPHTAFPSWF